MTTELRLDPAALRPLSRYHSVYEAGPRRYSIPATTEPNIWELWRRGLREQIRTRLGGFPATRTPLNVQRSTATKHAGYRRELIYFESRPGVVVPAWVLIPDGVDAPAPAMIAIHGHGYGVDDIVGIDADGADRDEPKGYHKDFAVALCRRGFVVIAPEMLAFGRRRELKDQEAGPEHSSCHDAAVWGIMLGQPLLGQRVWDVIRTIDYLETRPEVDPRRSKTGCGRRSSAAICVPLKTASCRSIIASVTMYLASSRTPKCTISRRSWRHVPC